MRANSKKERKTTLEIHYDKPTLINGIEVNSIAGLVKPSFDRHYLQPQNGLLKASYKREGKPDKVLYEIPFEGNDGFNDVLQLRNYNKIFAIDTNTKSVGKDTYSIAAIVECKILAMPFGSIASYSNIATMKILNPVGVAEKLAWRKWIQIVMKQPFFNILHKYCLIVDHDYGNINEYNKRIKPIVENFYLPMGFTLIYASSDKAESLVNQLIKKCDSVAKKKLKNL